jgi:hypothetical protein
MSPDKDALEASLEIYELGPKSATAAANAPHPIRGSKLPAQVVWIGADGTTSEPRIRVNLSEVINSDIRIRIKADTFTANGGRYKLNLDRDLTAGEAEDDYYGSWEVFSKTATPLTNLGGIVLPNPKGSLSLSNAVGVNFNSTTGDLINQVEVTIAADYRAENFSASLNSRIKIDKYDPASGRWNLAAITPSSFTRAGNGSSYTADFTSGDGDVLRARLTGLRTWTTTNDYWGFKQKYTTKDNDEDEEIVVAAEPSFDAAKYTSGSIARANAQVTASDGKDVYVSIPLFAPSAANGDKAGITDSSITPETIKIIGKKSVGPTDFYVDIKWESHSYAYDTWDDADAGTRKEYAVALLLKLPQSYKYRGDITFDVYITPQVTVGNKKARPDLVNNFHTLGVFNGIANKVTGTGSL